MRTQINVLIVVIAVVLTFSSLALGQAAETPSSAPPPEGWRQCPRCQNNADRRNAWAKTKPETHPFNPRDLSGIWGYEGVGGLFGNVPPLTPWGQQKFAARNGNSPVARSTPETRTCDPLGYPRQFGHNYGVEFVMLPDRVIQFFEWSHTWRTIWTDGRKLPAEPPEPHWLGWNVGRWEGDTFVIESNGFDERSWMSDQMTLVERYHRTSYGTMDAELTITDPKAFTRPWVVRDTIKLVPDTELWELFCVPSDEKEFEILVDRPVRQGNQRD